MTNGRSGIGQQIARTLAAEAASVVVHGRREEEEGEVRRVVKDIADGGGKALRAVRDLTSDEQASDAAVAGSDGSTSWSTTPAGSGADV